MSAFWWALLTAGIWGVVPLMEKIGLGGRDPAVGVFARSLGIVIGTAIFAAAASPWRALGEMGLKSASLLALGGFLASVVGQLAFYHALRTGAVSQVTPVAGCYPLVAALLGWWVLQEPLTLGRALGVVCIVAGVILLRR